MTFVGVCMGSVFAEWDDNGILNCYNCVTKGSIKLMFCLLMLTYTVNVLLKFCMPAFNNDVPIGF